MKVSVSVAALGLGLIIFCLGLLSWRRAGSSGEWPSWAPNLRSLLSVIGPLLDTSFAVNNARDFYPQRLLSNQLFPLLGYTVLAGSTYPEGNICVGLFAYRPFERGEV